MIDMDLLSEAEPMLCDFYKCDEVLYKLVPLGEYHFKHSGEKYSILVYRLFYPKSENERRRISYPSLWYYHDLVVNLERYKLEEKIKT